MRKALLWILIGTILYCLGSYISLFLNIYYYATKLLDAPYPMAEAIWIRQTLCRPIDLACCISILIGFLLAKKGNVYFRRGAFATIGVLVILVVADLLKILGLVDSYKSTASTILWSIILMTIVYFLQFGLSQIAESKKMTKTAQYFRRIFYYTILIPFANLFLRLLFGFLRLGVLPAEIATAVCIITLSVLEVTSILRLYKAHKISN